MDIFEYFNCYDKELILLTMDILNNNEIKKAFYKTWGENYDKVIDDNLYDTTFLNYTDEFKKTLNKVIIFKNIGFQNVDIKNILNSYQYNIYRKIVPDDRYINLLLKANRLNLENLTEEEKNILIYYYGINSKKMSMDEISNMLNVKKLYIYIQINKAFVKIVDALEVKKRNLESLYDYFEFRDKEKVKEIINIYKEKNSDYYKVIVKKYGLNYDELQNVKLNKEEEMKLNNARRAIKKMLNKNDNEKYNKESFYDYFDITEKEEVKKIIDFYKEKNSEYYKIIVKKYGPNYNELRYINFNQEETIKLNSARKAIREKLNKKKNKKYNKESFYDYFNPDEKEKVKEIIDSYKGRSTGYYEVIVKKYGPNYDKLRYVILNEEEKKKFKNAILLVKFKLNNPDREKKNKSSFYDYFKSDEKEMVKEIIDSYKEKDNDYYNIVVKYYGVNYDRLQGVKLTKKEMIKLNSFRTIIRKILSNKNNEMIQVYKRFPMLETVNEQVLIVLTMIIKNKYDVFKISNLTKLNIKDIDKILITYLFVFGKNIPIIIDDILLRENYTIDFFNDDKYKNNLFEFLTLEEQALYNDKIDSLTNNKIIIKK